MGRCFLVEMQVQNDYQIRMPRQGRIDAPGALHHIIIRGIERRAIFEEDPDRTEFPERPAGHVQCGEEDGGG